MSHDFAGKVAVVTGGAKGIGAATARLFVERGARVVVLDQDASGKTTGSETFIQCDVSDGAAVAEAFGSIERVDVLVNNAGIQHYGTVTDTSEEDWDRVLAVNLKSAFLCAKHAIAKMLQHQGGVIVNVASVQAFACQPNVVAYATSKTALLGLTRSIAVDFGPRVRCVAVCPGAVDTPMLRWAAEVMKPSAEVQKQSAEAHLIDRIARPEEIAELILYVASEKAGFMTGNAVRIDGGLGVALPGARAKSQP